MKFQVRNVCSDFNSYRAARVKSLFNAETGCNFDLDADIDLDGDWRLGVIVGPSGSGKTSLGKMVLGPEAYHAGFDWSPNAPIIDDICPEGDFNAVTGALSAVGLGTVPTWLRPFHVLSNGEKFRAELARIVCETPEAIVVDEFTSVVDRQIAKFGALAFSKSWKRTTGKCVLLSCHYDILEWLEPDWIFDTAKAEFSRGSLRRPKFDLEIHECGWEHWPLFEPHHYLKVPKMIGALCYVGTVDGEMVAHLAVATKNVGKACEARACRLVVMPEWQGAGVGTRFLDAICQMQLDGTGRLKGRHLTTSFHTSHPGLCMALRRNKRWRQLSGVLHGNNKAKSRQSLRKSAAEKNGGKPNNRVGAGSGYGGHFRAVQGFRYYGQAGIDAWNEKHGKP